MSTIKVVLEQMFNIHVEEVQSSSSFLTAVEKAPKGSLILFNEREE